MNEEIPEDEVPVTPPPITIDVLDRKVDQVLQTVDNIQIEMGQLRAAIKELIEEALGDDKPPPEKEGGSSMFG